MKIAVFGKKIDRTFEAGLNRFFEKVCNQKIEIFIYEPFYNFLKTTNLKICSSDIFQNYNQINSNFDFFISLGGDGSFLEAVRFVRNSNIPVVGINTGRLGFLAYIAQEDISHSLDCLFSGNYSIEERSLFAFHSDNSPFSDFPYALNDITVQKIDNSLITIETEVQGNYLNTYWADGLIVSTPTGTTAYSMSVGGPIVAPDCRTIIISPIASHNLTVRPIVITDNLEIKLNIHSRAGRFLASIDSYSRELQSGNQITIRLADFKINIVRLPDQTFYNTMRKKLMWGADIRN